MDLSRLASTEVEVRRGDPESPWSSLCRETWGEPITSIGILRLLTWTWFDCRLNYFILFFNPWLNFRAFLWIFGGCEGEYDDSPSWFGFLSYLGCVIHQVGVGDPLSCPRPPAWPGAHSPGSLETVGAVTSWHLGDCHLQTPPLGPGAALAALAPGLSALEERRTQTRPGPPLRTRRVSWRMTVAQLLDSPVGIQSWGFRPELHSLHRVICGVLIEVKFTWGLSVVTVADNFSITGLTGSCVVSVITSRVKITPFILVIWRFMLIIAVG